MNDMDLIRSESHILCVNNVRKTGLCNFDDTFLEKFNKQSCLWTF